MKMKYIALTVTMAALLMVSLIGYTQQETTLAIAGHNGQQSLLHLNGRWYVDIDSLAHLMHGTLLFKGNRFILTLHSSPEETSVVEPPARQGFSREFLQSEIKELSAIREWRITIISAVQNNSPLAEEWLFAQRRLANKNLAYVSASLTTDDDRSGFALLATEFSNMQKLSDRYLAMRKQVAFISPDSLDSDSLNQQILNCAHGLAAMAANHSFQDDPACH
jgi:hypothetical protein